jgi:hypothetical protein
MPDSGSQSELNTQAKSELPKPQYMAPAEDLMQGTKLQKAYDAAKDWLSEHEQHLSEKYLAPFRQGLDNMADDIERSPYVKASGPVTKGAAYGVAEAMRSTPVGKDVKETAGMAAMGALPEGHLFEDIEGVRAATPKEVIEGEGMVYKGELTKDSGVHMFEHPDHPGKTAALDASEMNPKNVRDKMDSKIKEFSAGEKEVKPFDVEWLPGGKYAVKNKKGIELGRYASREEAEKESYRLSKQSATAKEEQKQVVKNASGESAASQEAINRTAGEKKKGETYHRIDTRSKKETPIIGVDRVDAKAGPYDIVIKRGTQGLTVLDTGAKARPVPALR